MPNGMQFNIPMPRLAVPVGMQPPQQINYQKQLAGLSPFNAMQSLIGSGYQPMDAAAAYQQYQQTGQGPQPTWDNFTWAGGGGRYALPQLPGMPQQQQAPVPPPMGGGSTGFNLGAPGTPFNRTPFYLEPGRDNAGATTGSGTPPRIMPPRVTVPQIPPEMAGMQLGGGFAGVAPNVMQQAQQAGMGGMTAGATPAGQGLRPWEAGTPGLSQQQNSYNFLMAQPGMSPERARGISGWTGQGNAAALSWQNDPLNSVQAAQYRQGIASNQANIASEQARRTSLPPPPLPNIPRAPTQAASRPGYAPGGQSLNTYGTPMAGRRAQLGSSGYRY